MIPPYDESMVTLGHLPLPTTARPLALYVGRDPQSAIPPNRFRRRTNKSYDKYESGREKSGLN